MFTSVRIQNFRQFRDLELKNLGRINLITGQNNTGKTSLLEALNLLVAPNDPWVVATHARLRGVGRIAVDGSQAWGFIFRDGDIEQPITLAGHRMNGRRDVLNIRELRDSPLTIGDGGSTNGAGSKSTISTLSSPSSGLEYAYESESGDEHVSVISRIVRDGRNWTLVPAPVPQPWRWYFLATRPADLGQSGGDDSPRLSEAEGEAQRFSQLIMQRRKSEVIDAVRVMEPRLTDLQVLDLPPPTIAADIGLRSLIPMAYLGQGFGRMLKIVQAILTTEGGVVFIDEIEDGLHYSVLPSVWKAIIAAAHKHDVQIFATTHSLEAIEAATQTSAERGAGATLIRLERDGPDIRAVSADERELQAAVGLGFEMR